MELWLENNVILLFDLLNLGKNELHRVSPVEFMPNDTVILVSRESEEVDPLARGNQPNALVDWIYKLRLVDDLGRHVRKVPRQEDPAAVPGPEIDPAAGAHEDVVRFVVVVKARCIARDAVVPEHGDQPVRLLF